MLKRVTFSIDNAFAITCTTSTTLVCIRRQTLDTLSYVIIKTCHLKGLNASIRDGMPCVISNLLLLWLLTKHIV